MKSFSVLFYFSLAIYNSYQESSYNAVQIKNFKMTKCNNDDYPVMMYNVSIQLGTQPKVRVSGTLSTEFDLDAPIKAIVLIERKIFGEWIPIPCEGKIGSCTHDNLCDYGYPTNTSCPDIFQKNDIPCRCPIAKGNYTIPVSLDISKVTSVYSGSYKGSVNVAQNDVLLTCYNFNFIIYDENELNSVFLV